MSLTIRPATLDDVDTLADLAVADAERRNSVNRTLWALTPDARDKSAASIRDAMQADPAPFRQQWLMAEQDGAVVGMAHSILLPVPPIYAGVFGPPGLIMEDCFVKDAAPAGAQKALLDAAEADLLDAGAKILVASSIAHGPWESIYAGRGYAPLTLYLAKTGLENEGLGDTAPADGVRKAHAGDVPGIVASSADNRQVLFDLHPFWEPHAEADARFGNWMTRSLTLTDRDMFVSETGGTIDGYAISHPATPLHFPAPHDIDGIGVIDDYYHAALRDPDKLSGDADAARALFEAAEAALKTRGRDTALVVCPAAWESKIALLDKMGYDTAIVWYIKGGAFD